MLFNFRLKPLNEVTPWGGPDKPNLHWFGLTEGEFWIEVGDSTLFHYSAEAQNLFGGSPYCDYYVVRLHEDLLEHAPYLLEPVPPDLQPLLLAMISLEDGAPSPLRRRLDAYYDSDGPDDQRLDDAVGCVSEFLGRRQIVASYLVDGPQLAFWSDSVWTNFVWNTEISAKDAVRRWSAPSGGTKMPREVFTKELTRFHERLFAEMGARVTAVLQGALSPNIQIDIAGLLYDHEKRRREIEAALRPPERQTDWDAVRAAIREIEKIAL